MSCEVLPLCPQPRRSLGGQFFQSKASSPTTPEPYQTQACHELRELLSREPRDGPLSPECGRSFVTPPLSTASTSVGPSPHGNGCLSPTDYAWSHSVETAASARPRKGSGTAGDGQKRKLFVGGIPQEMDQDTLHEEFSRFGAVKKAWIQRAREGSKSGPAFHRGFGFVIFRDDDAFERLLDGELSKFIFLSGGCKVEVKRALSSREMTAGGQVTGAQTPEAGDAARDTAATDHLAAAEYHPCQAQGSASYEVSRSPPVIFAMPMLSGMPCAVQSPPVGWTNVPSLAGAAGATTGFYPAQGNAVFQRADLAPPAPCSSPESLQQRAAELYGSELVSALLCAMPEHYED
eukprot:TRINITY_DN7078_c0_g1_i2.p1 TRINITY_DN7078_c0_g1~~TRINITY_DN7078_c0_g1_i2.p1  ORF type:complete len:348 (+),score=66.06 TRINITY_DN7078_c0_g1_i2:68-1111(+)